MLVWILPYFAITIIKYFTIALHGGFGITSRWHLRSNLVCLPGLVSLCLKIMLFLKILWVGSTVSLLLSLDLIMSLLSAGGATGMERPRMASPTASEADVGSWLGALTVFHIPFHLLVDWTSFLMWQTQCSTPRGGNSKTSSDPVSGVTKVTSDPFYWTEPITKPAQMQRHGM